MRDGHYALSEKAKATYERVFRVNIEPEEGAFKRAFEAEFDQAQLDEAERREIRMYYGDPEQERLRLVAEGKIASDDLVRDLKAYGADTSGLGWPD